MAEQVVRPGPFTVERNGEPVDIGLRLIALDHGGVDGYEWLSPDRWHVLITPATPEQMLEERAEATDDDGVVWTFRPVEDRDHALVVGDGVPSTGFAAWLRRTVGNEQLGIASA